MDVSGCVMAALLAVPFLALPAHAGGQAPGLEARKPGDVAQLGTHRVTVREMDVTPVVRNEYSARYSFDCYGNELLETLREQERLDDVVAAGKTEFDKQVLLMDWTYKRFPLFGPPGGKPNSTLEILKAVDEGKSFNCGFFARVNRDALAAMGYVVRGVGLKGAKSDGNGSEHSILEVWSNQYRKWIVLDPTLNVYFEKDGKPLNAYEIRQEWFYNDGKDLTIVIGPARERHPVSDLPIDRAYHKGFGMLGINDRSIGKFLYIAYTPKTADGGPDYGRMFITKDALCEGLSYHTRKCPDDPAREPYWPMCQADLKLAVADGAKLKVTVDTFTPDFAGYRSRVDGGDWREGALESWGLHAGTNSLEVVAVNEFGLTGLPSKVVLDVQ